MRVCSCLHPQVKRNIYTGEDVVVRCGRCESCRNTRAALWVQKLDAEMHAHKYTLFVTLQYDELNVPQVVRLRKEDTPFISGAYSWSYINSLTGEIFSYDDPSITRHNKADNNFVFNTKVLLVLSKKDIQNFIKRLRYYAKELTNCYQNVRYFITGEYGGKTFRPHAHALLFFDDDRIALNIENLLNKSWRFGCVFEPHFVSGSASQYVASYVNSFSKLPSIYSHERLRQFSLFSKSPAIGTLQFLSEDYRKLFFERLTSIRTFDQFHSKFVDVPLWRTLQDRCFPRIPRFNSLPDSLRNTLYNFGLRFFESDCKDSRTFARWLEIYYSGRFKRGTRTDELAHYFYDISHIPYYDKTTQSYSVRFSINPLINFVRIVKRVAVTAYSYGLTISDYVTNIKQFYDELQKSNYKEQLKFQDNYFKLHPEEKHGLYFDLAFVDRVDGSNVNELSQSDLYYLRSNMLIDDSTKVVDLPLSDCFDFRDMLSMHEVIAHKTNKTKLMNDYVFKHSERFKNILNYYKDLNDI